MVELHGQERTSDYAAGSARVMVSDVGPIQRGNQRQIQRVLLATLALTGAFCWASVGCNVSPPTSPPPSLTVMRKRPPGKPGDSITETQMCSCQVCEPNSCCRELEQDAPEASKDCAEGYDFSRCEMPVSSCDSRCFKHRWRTRVETGCEATRPDKCCHASAAF